jgi:hypothetical protein
MTVQGLGAALRPAIGGAIAQARGFWIALLTLCGFALGSLVLWVVFSTHLKPACANQPGADDALSAPTKLGGARTP